MVSMIRRVLPVPPGSQISSGVKSYPFYPCVPDLVLNSYTDNSRRGIVLQGPNHDSTAKLTVQLTVARILCRPDI